MVNEKSIKNACKGLRELITEDPNIKFDFIVMLGISVFVLIFQPGVFESIILFLCCGIQITVEIFNTVIEKTCNFITGEKRDEIRVIKDYSAGGVLFITLINISIGLGIILNTILADVIFQ